MSTKYEVIIYWSRADDAFIAEVPELPGCMTHGASRAEALAMAEDAIQGWLASAREFGDLVPEPKGRKLVYA